MSCRREGHRQLNNQMTRLAFEHFRVWCTIFHQKAVSLHWCKVTDKLGKTPLGWGSLWARDILSILAGILPEAAQEYQGLSFPVLAKSIPSASDQHVPRRRMPRKIDTDVSKG